jgi:hypothetical protein
MLRVQARSVVFPTLEKNYIQCMLFLMFIMF